MDSDSEEEIFFGPVTAKEEEIAGPLRNRKTEIFIPSSSPLDCRSSVPSLSSLEEEDCKSDSSNSKQCVLNCDSHWADSMDTRDVNKLKNVSHKGTERGTLVSTSYEDTAAFASRRPVFAVFENNEIQSYTIREDDGNTKSDILFGQEKDLSSTGNKASDNYSVNVSQGNVFEVFAANLSSVSTEVIKDGSQLVKVNGPEVLIQEAVIPSAKACALANEDISDVQLLSSLKGTDELLQEKLCMVPETVRPIDNTEIERETLSCISARVCDNEPFANVKMRDETMSVADVNIASKVMSSPTKFSAGDISSCSLVRIQEEVTALFDDKIINPESSLEVANKAESTVKKSDLYMPALNIESGEYIMINNNGKADDKAVSLACLTLDESRSLSAVEIIEESESIVTSTNVVDTETMKVIPLTNVFTADALTEFANKRRGCKETVARLQSNLDFVTFKFGDPNVESFILEEEEASPSETSGSLKTDGALLECKGYKNTLEIYDLKDFKDPNVDSVILEEEEASPSETSGSLKTDGALLECKGYKNTPEIYDPKDPNSIDNHVSRCFCNDIEVGALLTDKRQDDCVCSKKFSVNNQLVGCDRGTDRVSVCASEKQFTTVIENFPSRWSANVIGQISLSSKSVPSSMSELSDYPQQQADSSSESYDIINERFKFSQTPNSESGLPSSCSHDYSPVLVTTASNECEMRSVPVVNSSKLGSELRESIALENPILCNDQVESNTVQKPLKIVDCPLDVSGDERQSEASSPARKFNDTIEEMEMLLKYGVHYGETGVLRSNCSHTDEKKCVNKGIDCALDDSIVSPRKLSVMSSVSHFDPEFNSTSVPTTKNCVVPAKLEGNVETQEIQELNTNLHQLKVSKALTPAALPKVTKALTPASVFKETKALPPQKPPRNAFMLCPSPLNSNSALIPSHNPKVHSHLTPDLPEEKCKLRKDEVVRHATSKSNPTTPKSSSRRFNPTTPLYTGVKSKINSGILSQKLESRTTNKTPAKIVGVARSTSLTNMSKESMSHGSVAVSPLCVPSTRANNALSGHYAPKSQAPRSIAKERFLHKHIHVPYSTPSKFVGKPPMGQISKTMQKVKALNPNPLAKKQTYIRQAGMNIVSPVARYLRENPPPPLVINIKPRYKITGNVEKVTQMDVKASPESGDAKCREANQRSKHAHVLPVALYSPAVNVLLENVEDKENERSRKLQELSSSSQQLLVMKHKGRVKVPKVKFKDDVNKNSSPKGSQIPNPVEAAITPARNSSLRGSLMEVSIYEPHKTQYTDTLKLLM